MMSFFKKSITKFPLLVILFSNASLARADYEYYTYGSFETILNEFTLVASIFSDAEYLVLAFCVALLGTLIGMGIRAGQGAMGKAKGSGAFATFFLGLFGTALMLALFMPKTTMHIYDTTSNRYEAVGNVPEALGFLASLSNILERYVTEIVSNATPYAKDRHANGKSLELLLNLVNSDPLPSDINVSKTIDSYISMCVPPAIASPAYGFDYNGLLNGTTNVWNELQNTRNSSQFFTWYDSTNQGGVAQNCHDGYNALQTVLLDPTTFSQHISNVCAASGFDPTNPVFLNDCKNLIAEVIPMVFAGSVQPTAENISAIGAVSRALYELLAENPGTAISAIGNSKQLSQGYGAVIVGEGWIPAMRASTLAIILALSPIMVLLIASPLVFRALHMLCALFGFLFFWGAADSIIHAVILHQIQDLFMELKSFENGLRGFMLAPTPLQQGLAMFGKMQSVGVLFAALCAAYFFKFTGMQFANMGEKLAGDIDATGKETGEGAIDVTNRANNMDTHAAAAQKHEYKNYIGPELYGASVGKSAVSRDAANAEYLGEMQEYGIGSTDAISMEAQKTGGSTAGSVLARNDLAGSTQDNIRDVSRELSQVDQSHSDSSTNVIGDLQERVGGRASVEGSDELAQIERSDLIGKMDASQTPKDHIEVSETATRQMIGEKQEVRDSAKDNKTSVERQQSMMTGNTLEDGYAIKAFRDGQVADGEAKNTQDVARKTTEASGINSLGNYKALENVAAENDGKSTLDLSEISSENAYRGTLAADKAREAVANSEDLREQEIADNAALTQAESGQSEFKKREELSYYTGMDRQEISDKQNSSVNLPLTTKEMEAFNQNTQREIFDQNDMNAASTNDGGVLKGDFIYGDDETSFVATRLTAGDALQVDNQTSLLSGLTSKNAGSIITSGSEEDIVALLKTTEGDATKMIEISRDLANSSMLSRSNTESDGMELRNYVNGGVKAQVSTDVKSLATGGLLDGENQDSPKSKFESMGYGTSSNNQPTNSGDGSGSKILQNAGKAIAGIPPVNASVGGSVGAGHTTSFTDSSMGNTSVDPTTAKIFQAMGESYSQLSNDSERNNEVANDFREKILNLYDLDANQGMEAVQDFDMNGIEDEGFIDRVMDMLNLGDDEEVDRIL